MGAKQYVRGVAIGLGFVILVIIGLIFLGVIQLIAELGMLILGIIFLVIAILILPHYLGEKKVVKSKKYSLKKVKG